MRLIEGASFCASGKPSSAKRAIGFEFEQALHQRAGAFRAEAAIDDKNAHEARRVELEIGRIERGAVGILRDRKARAVEDAFRRERSLASAMRCRSIAASSGPGCGNKPIGEASEEAAG